MGQLRLGGEAADPGGPFVQLLRLVPVAEPLVYVLAFPLERKRSPVRLVTPLGRRGAYSGLMPDQKPPRLAGGEAETLHALLGYQRESLVRKVAGLDEASARWSPVGTGTSLLWLIKHTTRAGITWVGSRCAGRAVVRPGDQPEPGDTLAAAPGRYRRAGQLGDQVAFGGASLDEPCRRQDADP